VKKKRFSVEQITSVLQHVATGVPVGDVCRQFGVSEQTFYRWKKEYGGMLPSEARELKQLRDKNTTLKRLVAVLSLDKFILQDVVLKNSNACQAARDHARLDGPRHRQRTARLSGRPDDTLVGVRHESNSAAHEPPTAHARVGADPGAVRVSSPARPHAA
jgi:putative transposase